MTGGRTYFDFLQDMVDACAACLDFVSGLEITDYLQDSKTMQAVARLIGIIGEAANHIPGDVQLLAPEIPWGEIVGMRNRLIHEYFDVDHEIVWRTVQDNLTPLTASVRRLLDSSELARQAQGPE